MTLVLIVLLLTVTAQGRPADEEPTLCETGGPTNNTKTYCSFQEGKPVRIVAHGDLDEGCKFLARECCYMERIRNIEDDSELCDRFEQPTGCWGEPDFLVTEKKLGWEHGTCTLTLSSTSSEDQGMYEVVFPSSKKTNKNIEVKVVKTSSVFIPLVVFAVLLALAALAALIATYYFLIYRKRGSMSQR